MILSIALSSLIYSLILLIRSINVQLRQDVELSSTHFSIIYTLDYARTCYSSLLQGEFRTLNVLSKLPNDDQGHVTKGKAKYV